MFGAVLSLERGEVKNRQVHGVVRFLAKSLAYRAVIPFRRTTGEGVPETCLRVLHIVFMAEEVRLVIKHDELRCLANSYPEPEGHVTLLFTGLRTGFLLGEFLIGTVAACGPTEEAT